VRVWDVVVTLEPADAIARVYEEHGPKLWRSLYAFTGSREVASDALAEALAQAIARGDGIHSPERWIFTASFRIAAGEMKRRRREQPLEDIPHEMPEPTVDLVRALGTLSPRQRAVVILSLYAGYPTREIAHVLGSTPATVRVHLSQGRKRLRAALEEHDG
jgi:RNA polymerase sigma factor (sigma-70 family)